MWWAGIVSSIYLVNEQIAPPFQTLHPPPESGNQHHRGLLGQGVHAAAAAAGERHTSVAAKEAARATGVTADSSTFPNQVPKKEGEK